MLKMEVTKLVYNVVVNARLVVSISLLCVAVALSKSLSRAVWDSS
jgi:hypothetical protein